MPERSGRIVINTSPTLALIAATGSLEWLGNLYREVIMPLEVLEEIRAGSEDRGIKMVLSSSVINRWSSPTTAIPFLQNALDVGEAAVIQLALEQGIPLVCIDETAGRRCARLSGLRVTGSLGILLRAKRCGIFPRIRPCIESMLKQGIWLGPGLIEETLRLAGEMRAKD